jgi:hypothetical protein
LKLRLELRECPTLVRARGIALHDALEAEPANRCDEVQGASQDHRADWAPERRCSNTGDCCNDQRRDQHCFFAHSVAQPRRNGVTHHGNKT